MSPPDAQTAIATAIQTRSDGWAWLALVALREGRIEDAAFYAAHEPGERMRVRECAA